MPTGEMAIWSAMSGVLLTLAVVATFDMASRPTRAAVRASFLTEAGKSGLLAEIDAYAAG